MAQKVAPRPPTRERRALRRSAARHLVLVTLLALGGAAVPILAFELLLRVLGPFFPGEYQLGLFMVPHERYGQFHAQDTVAWFRTDEYRSRVQTNRLGLRGGEVATSRTPGVGRILVAGDSFVEARQVSEMETVPSVLAAALNGNEADRQAGKLSMPFCEVVNAGVAGWGTGEVYVYLRDEGLQLRPDLVVLVFYLGNDVTNNLRRADPAPGWHAGPGFRIEADGSLTALPFELRPERSWVSQTLRQSLLAYTFLESGILAKLDDNEDMETTAGVGRHGLFSAQEPSAIRRGWRLTETLLGAIKAETERAGSRLMLVAAPTAYQVHAEEQRRFVRSDRARKAEVQLDLPNRRLAEIAARLDLPFLDLLPVFTQVGANTRLFFRQDPHWTVAGASVAGTNVARELGARPELLPPGCLRHD